LRFVVQTRVIRGFYTTKPAGLADRGGWRGRLGEGGRPGVADRAAWGGRPGRPGAADRVAWGADRAAWVADRAAWRGRPERLGWPTGAVGPGPGRPPT